jgi:colanic acid/amylovoran biosynthesis glycosyltransferase
MQGIIIFRKYFYPKSETFIYTQVNFLKKYFKVFLVAEKFSKESSYSFSNINKVKLNGYESRIGRIIHKIFRSNIDPKFRINNYFQIKRLIKEQNIKLIHAHFGSDAIRILPVAKKNNIPLVVTFHGFDASSLLKNTWYKNNLPHLFNYASKIIIVSHHMMESLELNRWKSKVLLLPCSVDVEEFKPFKREKKDKIHLLHSGRIVNKKGVPDLIKVFSNLYKENKNLHLTVVGDGPELAYCKSEANHLNINEAISFCGSQPHAIVKILINESDIFILNSRTADDGDMEGTPVSILEAMSMAKAVVSTYHAGIPDVIEDGVNGLLVPEKNNELLEIAISKLIQNEEMRIKMGVEARNTVISKFSQDRNLPLLRETLQGILNNEVEEDIPESLIHN